MTEVFLDFWLAIEPAHQFLAALSLSLATAGMLALFRPEVKLTWGSTSVSFHRFKLSDDGDPIAIATEKLFVQNIGRKAANGIELVLNDIPSSYTLWPPREHTSNPLEGGGFSIKIPTLAPHELLIVDTIDIDRRNLHLVAVNCPDALAKPVQFQVQRKYGKLFTVLVGYLMFAGLMGSIYLLLNLVL